jgi:glycosyltransferase involved in cell wall biosynthesis
VSKSLPGSLQQATVAILPAHDEAGNVGPLVNELRRLYPDLAIVVVDDGSRDGTGSEARRAGALVLTLACNLGIAGAVQAGYRYALERGFEYAIRLDGDGQHDPAGLPVLLERLASGECDLVIGSRFLQEGEYRSTMPRRLGIRFFVTVLRLFTGYRVTDPTSGYIGVNRRSMAFLVDHLPEDYPEIETILAAWYCRFRLQEVPVTMRRRDKGQSSITLLGSIYYLLAVSLGMLAGLFKSRPEAGR